MRFFASLLLTVSILFLSVVAAFAERSNLSSVRFDSDHETVLILLDKKTEFRLYKYSDPARVVLDLKETQPPVPSFSQEVQSPSVKKIRYSLYMENPSVTRVVLEVKDTKDWRVTAEESSAGYLLKLSRAPLTETIENPSPPKIEPPSGPVKDAKGFIFQKIASGAVKSMIIGRGQIRLNLRWAFSPEIRLSSDRQELSFWIPDGAEQDLPRTIEVGDAVFQYMTLEESETPGGERAIKVKVKLQQPSAFQKEVDSTEEELRILVLPRTKILKVAVATSENHPQIQIESQVPLTAYKLFKLSDPQRLIIDIPEAEYTADKELAGVDGTSFLRLRGAQFSRDPLMTRVVIDLREKTKYEDALSPDGKKLLITLKEINVKENSRVVVIDPGHGGVDPGALTPSGVQEKDITLAIARQLKKVLEEKKYVVLMTRNEDVNLTLPPRIELANQNDADVMISIHCNSFPGNSEMVGMETYYYNGESFGLARMVHSALVKDLKREDRGIRKNSFVVIKYTAMPAILVETEYLSNADAEKFLTRPENQKHYAEAMAEGIEAYFSSLELFKESNEQQSHRPL